MVRFPSPVQGMGVEGLPDVSELVHILGNSSQSIRSFNGRDQWPDNHLGPEEPLLGKKISCVSENLGYGKAEEFYAQAP